MACISRDHVSFVRVSYRVRHVGSDGTSLATQEVGGDCLGKDFECKK